MRGSLIRRSLLLKPPGGGHVPVRLRQRSTELGPAVALVVDYYQLTAWPAAVQLPGGDQRAADVHLTVDENGRQMGH